MKLGPIIGTFSGKCCDYSVFNNNDMKLSRQLFDNLINSEEYKRAMQHRHYIGYLGHPEDPNCMDYQNGCIVMTDMNMLDNGDVEGNFDLVNTPVGQVVKSFIDVGVEFGISIRGAGDVDGEGNVDPDTFIFRGFDLVTFPAYDDCIPKFQEIAASSDLDKQKKFKKVCAAIERNLPKITSCSALEVIKDQFREDQKQYSDISNRIAELSQPEKGEAIVDQQVAGLTDLLLEEKAKNAELEQQLMESQCHVNEVELMCSRKIASYKRIAASQIKDLESAYDKVVTANTSLKQRLNERNTRAIAASAQISKLKENVNSLKSENLKYVHKIEANSTAIAQKDSIIGELEAKVSKTVTANKQIKQETSNLDADIKELKSRVEAAEQMVLDYQQAYANMYANALGVHLENLSITAATKPSELETMICSGTSTSNVGALPDIDDSLIDSDELTDEEVGAIVVI